MFGNVEKLYRPEGEVVRISCGTDILWERPNIPLVYQQVEYIETDGNQYIDTGVLASDYPDGIRYAMKGNLTSYQTTAVIYWFGALASNRRSGNVYSHSSTPYIGLFIGGSGTATHRFAGNSAPEPGTDFELIVEGTPASSNDATMTIDGVSAYASGTLIDTAMPDANIWFLTANGTSASTTADRKFYGKVYSFALGATDGTPIRDFVPCYRKSDGVAGFYDKTGGAFYTNQGSGGFSVGADV